MSSVMVREVNSFNNTTPPASGNTGTGRGAQPKEGTPTPGQESSAPGSDRVNLSDNAQALRAVESQVKNLPEVNEQRVAEIRSALDSGRYQVDDLVVADKLIAFEGLFD